jgi:hypothetical protein
MKHITIAVVGVMVLLAGCAGGTGDATPTADSPTESPSTPDTTTGAITSTVTSSQTPPEEATDTHSDVNVGPAQAVAGETNQLPWPEGPGRIEMTMVSGGETLQLTLINDTEEQLIVINKTTLRGPTTYYLTDGPDAVRNRTTGEIRYGSGKSEIETSARFTGALLLAVAVNPVTAIEWEPAEQTVVDGETRAVAVADSINQTALEAKYAGRSFHNVTAVEGQVVSVEGQLRSIAFTLDEPDASTSVEVNIHREDIKVDRPSWVNNTKFDSS